MPWRREHAFIILSCRRYLSKSCHWSSAGTVHVYTSTRCSSWCAPSRVQCSKNFRNGRYTGWKRFALGFQNSSCRPEAWQVKKSYTEQSIPNILNKRRWYIQSFWNLVFPVRNSINNKDYFSLYFLIPSVFGKYFQDLWTRIFSGFFLIFFGTNSWIYSFTGQDHQTILTFLEKLLHDLRDNSFPYLRK